MCLFCSHVCTGNRTVLFQHMLETHNFNVGHADNIGENTEDYCSLPSAHAVYIHVILSLQYLWKSFEHSKAEARKVSRILCQCHLNYVKCVWTHLYSLTPFHGSLPFHHIFINPLTHVRIQLSMLIL